MSPYFFFHQSKDLDQRNLPSSILLSRLPRSSSSFSSIILLPVHLDIPIPARTKFLLAHVLEQITPLKVLVWMNNGLELRGSHDALVASLSELIFVNVFKYPLFCCRIKAVSTREKETLREMGKEREKKKRKEKTNIPVTSHVKLLLLLILCNALQHAPLVDPGRLQ